MRRIATLICERQSIFKNCWIVFNVNIILECSWGPARNGGALSPAPLVRARRQPRTAFRVEIIARSKLHVGHARHDLCHFQFYDYWYEFELYVC